MVGQNAFIANNLLFLIIYLELLGDKVMVCLSGGKDSLSLLHTLLQYQSHAQKEGVLFSIGAITVDPDSSGCDPCILIPHLKSLGVHYIIDDKKSDPGCATGQSKGYFKRTRFII